MKEQPASVINTCQTFYHISVLDPGRGKIAGRSAGPGPQGAAATQGASAVGTVQRTPAPQGRPGEPWGQRGRVAQTG